jgi:hypothetical protein
MTEKSFKDLPIGDAHLREERLSGEDIYGGIFLNMKRDQVSLPDGNQAVREYLTHPGAVAILAILMMAGYCWSANIATPLPRPVLRFLRVSWKLVKIDCFVRNESLRKRRATLQVNGVLYAAFIQ